MKMMQYFWTYGLVRGIVWTAVVSIVVVLLFYGITSGVVARRSRKSGVRGALTIAQLNAMSHQKEVCK